MRRPFAFARVALAAVIVLAPVAHVRAQAAPAQRYVIVQPDIVYETGKPGSSALDCVTSVVKKVIELCYAEWYNAARRWGKEVVFLSYPGKPHHLAKRRTRRIPRFT